MTMAPLVCTPTAQTVPFAPVPGVKEVSRLPLLLSRARQFRRAPLYEEKFPPITGRPAESNTIELMKFPPLVTRLIPLPGLNDVSSEPSTFTRAMPLWLGEVL